MKYSHKSLHVFHCITVPSLASTPQLSQNFPRENLLEGGKEAKLKGGGQIKTDWLVSETDRRKQEKGESLVGGGGLS